MTTTLSTAGSTCPTSTCQQLDTTPTQSFYALYQSFYALNQSFYVRTKPFKLQIQEQALGVDAALLDHHHPVHRGQHLLIEHRSDMQGQTLDPTQIRNARPESGQGQIETMYILSVGNNVYPFR